MTHTDRRTRLFLDNLESRDVPSTSLIFADDFQSGVAQAGWSRTGVSATPNRGPDGPRQFLGQFAGNQTVNLSLNSLPTHSHLTVEFDLYVIHSWDGNNPTWGGNSSNGKNGDRWSFSIDGQTQLNTTFRNWRTHQAGNTDLMQEYGPAGTVPDGFANGQPLYDARTGALEVNTLGYTFTTGGTTYQLDSVYRFSFTIWHTDATALLRFAGSGLQALADESWGLDNVRVWAGNPGPATIGDFVWHDLNANGRQDPGEPGLSDVTVQLLANAEIVQTTTTDQDGKYQFLVSDDRWDYQVRIIIPDGMSATARYAGDSEQDSDIGQAGFSDPFLINAGGIHLTLDAGLISIAPGSISGMVWSDDNADGFRNANEQGIAGVEVNLYNEHMAFVTTTITDALGHHQFDSLAPHVHYRVEFVAPVGFMVTERQVGPPDIDSDADIYGFTDPIWVGPDTTNPFIDAGMNQGAGPQLQDTPWSALVRAKLNAPANQGGWDLNGDGKITLVEIRRLLKSHGEAGEPAKVEGRDAAALAMLYAHFDQLKTDYRIVSDGLTAQGLDRYKNQFPVNRVFQWFEADFEDYAAQIAATSRTTFKNQFPDPLAGRQGLANDCVFLSMMADLAKRNPQFVKAMIVNEQEANGIKEYTVKFAGANAITVKAPTDTEIALYASARTDGLWLSILEKAYVTVKNLESTWLFRKMHAYETLQKHGVEATTVYQTLLNPQSGIETLVVNPTKEAAVRQALANAQTLGRTVVAGSKHRDKFDPAVDMPSAHAFAVIGYSVAEGTVTLQNPWMKETFHGANVKFGTVFTIPIAAFLSEFSVLYFNN